MAQMRVDEVLPSKSGKAWRVKSGGKWYNAFGDSGIEGHVGKLIEAEITTHETYGAGIGKYRVIEQGQTTKPMPVPQIAIPNQQQQPQYQQPPYWIQFVSNQVAHAIAAGLIKEPLQMKEWTFAAMNAIKGAVEGDIEF